MGTDDPAGYPADGEGPAHRVSVPAFRMSMHAITNDLFASFVADTDHQTTAEEIGTSFVFGGLLPDDFPPTRAVAATPWWRDVEGANWRHSEGPHSDLDGRGDHPVVHVSWFDATSFCRRWHAVAHRGRVGASRPRRARRLTLPLGRPA